MSVTRSFSGTALDRIYFDKLTHPMALAVRGGTASTPPPTRANATCISPDGFAIFEELT